MLRTLVFWLHLLCGVVAGLVIAVMCFTGVMLAYEKDIVAWAERDVRRVAPGASTARFPVDDLAGRVQARFSSLATANVVVPRDPTIAVAVMPAGRGAAGPTVYVNPYDGTMHEASASKTRAFMRTMTTWHRWLGVEGDHRNIAKAVTGACNFAFLGLAITGLYLWWPRQWSRQAVRAVALLRLRLHGKPRDFNWHNVVGLWCAPILIVLTATALPISYRWAGDAIYRLTRTEPPTPGAPGTASASPVVPPPAADAHRATYETLVRQVADAHPAWAQITFRKESERGTAGSTAGASARAERGRIPGPVSFTVKETGSWPRTATTTVHLDPFSGAVLARETFADLNAGRQIRSWTRFLHTGEALGWIGQAVAGLASFGGLVLAYTGLALSWRRFFGRR